MSVSITLWLRQVLLAGRADAQSLMRRVCLQLGSFPVQSRGLKLSRMNNGDGCRRRRASANLRSEIAILERPDCRRAQPVLSNTILEDREAHHTQQPPRRDLSEVPPPGAQACAAKLPGGLQDRSLIAVIAAVRASELRKLFYSRCE